MTLKSNHTNAYANSVVRYIVENDLTMRQAAKKFDVPFGTIVSWMERRNVKLHRHATKWDTSNMTFIYDV